MNLDSKTIMHVDINSYFATMLQQKYPRLRDKPVGIVKDVGRTCIIAASKQAKKLGVKTGSSVKDARLYAPNIILAPAEFDFYLDSTKKLKKIFESFSPDIDIFSLDEAFIDITSCQTHLPGYQNPKLVAQSIKAKIKQELGEFVTCNIGISYNKFLSKLGSELSPKDTIVEVNQSNKNEFLSTTDFSSVCGIGFRLERRLHQLGIDSLYALNFVSDDLLLEHFGSFWANQLRVMSTGGEPHLFHTRDKNPHAKSIGRSITGFRLAGNQDHIQSVLYNLSIEIIHKLRKMNLAGRQVRIALYGSHGQRWSRHLTLGHHIYHLDEFFHYAYHILYKSWLHPFPIIKFALNLSLLEPIDQLSLPILPSWHKRERLESAINHLSDKFGLFTVRSGLLLNRQIIYPEVTGFLGDKHYQLELT